MQRDTEGAGGAEEVRAQGRGMQGGVTWTKRGRR